MIPIEARQLEPATLAAIEQTQYVFHEIIKRTPDSFGDDERAALLMAFSSITMEHFRSIVALCGSHVGMGSAMALFRPLLESNVRGEWLYFCADAAQRECFMKKKKFVFPPFKDMLDAVDAKVDHGDRLGMFAPYYGYCCDYTHTGHDAVTRRIAEDGGIEPNYPESMIRVLVTTAARVVVTHYVILCEAMGHQEHREELEALFEAIPD